MYRIFASTCGPHIDYCVEILPNAVAALEMEICAVSNEATVDEQHKRCIR